MAGEGSGENAAGRTEETPDEHGAGDVRHHPGDEVVDLVVEVETMAEALETLADTVGVMQERLLLIGQQVDDVWMERNGER